MIDTKKKIYDQKGEDDCYAGLATFSLAVFLISWGFSNFPLGLGIGLITYIISSICISKILKSDYKKVNNVTDSVE